MAPLSSPDLRLRLLLTGLPSAGRVRPIPGPQLCQAGLSLCGWFCRDVSRGDGAWIVTVVAFGLCLLPNPCPFGKSLPPPPAGLLVQEACILVNGSPAFPSDAVPTLRGTPTARREASLSGRTSESNDEGQTPFPTGWAPHRPLGFCPLPASQPLTGSPRRSFTQSPTITVSTGPSSPGSLSSALPGTITH